MWTFMLSIGLLSSKSMHQSESHLSPLTHMEAHTPQVAVGAKKKKAPQVRVMCPKQTSPMFFSRGNQLFPKALGA